VIAAGRARRPPDGRWVGGATLSDVYKNLFNAEGAEDAEKLILRGTTCMMERRGWFVGSRVFIPRSDLL